jgi:hypothetical protein
MMDNSYRKPLSDDERKQLDPVVDRFEAALEDLTAEMARLGRRLTFDEEPNLGRCRRCACPGFSFASAGLRCKNCNHSRFVHEGGV